MFGQPQEGLED